MCISGLIYAYICGMSLDENSLTRASLGNMARMGWTRTRDDIGIGDRREREI